MTHYSSASLLDTNEVRARVGCPQCGAAKGEPCRRDDDLDKNHFERIKAARADLYRKRRGLRR